MEVQNNIVIVGGCIAAKEAANAILKNDLLANITIISSEAYLPYYRPMLSRAIGQEPDKSRFYLAPRSWYEENNINLVLGTEISKVIPEDNIVVSTNGDSYSYTQLLIATGSSNFIPIPNATDIDGVISIRDYNDITKLRNILPRVKKAIVVGSGLLGIEAAWELQQQNIDVTLMEFAPHVLPKQLDNQASDFLSKHINGLGTDITCGCAAQSILEEDGSIIGVKCSDGADYPCDLLIFSVGALPNIALVKDTNILTNRGIIVDNNMRTNIPNIYAAGDVAENEYNSSGLWLPAMEMGKVAGANIANQEASYKPVFTTTMLTAFDTRIFSIGEIPTGDDIKTEAIIDPDNRFFKKLFARDNILIGAILIGDISQGTRLTKSLGTKTLEEAKELIA